MKFAITVIFTVAIAYTLGAEEVLYSLSDLMRGPLSKRTNYVKKVEEVKEVEQVKEVMVKPAKEVNPYVYRPFYPKDKSQRHNVGYYFEPLGVDQAAPQPQFVLMTFDDAVTRQLFTQVYRTLLNRVDVQTSCPIHATFFTSHKHTDYAAVQALDSWGHEIALHSFTHGDDSRTPEENVRTNFTAQRWAKEVRANAEMAMGFADLTGPFGFRAPFLHTGGNALFQILAGSEFTMYDSSLTFPHSRKTWPYHLNNPRRQYYQGCSIKPCPTRTFNLWEVPLGLWKDINENDCQMMDGCNLGSTVEEALSVMMRNFNDYRRDNIPFPLMMHAAVFLNGEREFVKTAFTTFIDTLLAEDNVHFVTIKDLLNFIENPLSTGQDFTNFRAKFCHSLKLTEKLGREKCERVSLCVYGNTEISTCKRCPASLPTI